MICQKLNLKSSARNSLFFVGFLNVLIMFIYYLNCPLYKRFETLKIFKEEIIDNPNRMFDVPEFKYLIPKSKCDCNGSTPYFITLVNSSPTQYQRRAACRETWAHSDPRTKTYFMIGIPQTKSLQRKIEEEEAQYHDILQGNFIDSYHNLTYKYTMALKWFSENCPHVKYLLKLDDDVFVNVPATYEVLVNNKNDNKFIMGIYFPPHATSRNGKWKISTKDIREKFIPEYASGQSVIYSYDFVNEAYKRTFTTKFLWIDDIYISGYIRMQLNIRIEPIYPLRLSDDNLKMILNGTTTSLPQPMFIVSEHDRTYDDMIKLWEITRSYREAHPHKV